MSGSLRWALDGIMPRGSGTHFSAGDLVGSQANKAQDKTKTGEGGKASRWPWCHRLALGLCLLFVLLQYQLWWGTGGWYDLQAVEQRVTTQEAANAPLRDRNARLAAEVTDLKQGLDAIEERARSDMGMVRTDEQFFWVPGVAIEPALVEINAGLVAPMEEISE